MAATVAHSIRGSTDDGTRKNTHWPGWRAPAGTPRRAVRPLGDWFLPPNRLKFSAYARSSAPLYPMKSIFLPVMLAAALTLLLASPAARAQAPADGGPAPAGPTATPLDGGASLLLAGGVAYALRRLRRRPPAH